MIEKQAMFDLVIYRPLSGTVTKYSSMELILVDNFLPLWRQFSAVFDQHPEKISFIRALQGFRSADSIIRLVDPPIFSPSTPRSFEEMGSNNASALVVDSQIQHVEESNSTRVYDSELSMINCEEFSPEDDISKHHTVAPSCQAKCSLCSLNETQELAVDSFVNSAPASITIVQG
jgi:hypothetical protein